MTVNYQTDINTFQDAVDIFLRWRGVAGLTFLAVLIPALLVIFLMPPLYEATGQIIVNRGSSQENYEINTGVQLNGATTFRNIDKQEEVNTAAETIKTRKIIDATSNDLKLSKEKLDYIRDARRYVRAVINFFVDGFATVFNEIKYMTGLSKRPTQEEQALFDKEDLFDNIKDRLIVKPSTEANIIDVSFRSSDPFLAMETVNQLLNKYLEFYNSSSESKAKTFFSDETEKLGDDLYQTQKRLAQLKKENNAYSIDKQRTSLLDLVSATMGKQMNIRSEIAKLRAKAAELRKNSAKPVFRDMLQGAEVEMASLVAEDGALTNILSEYQEKLARLSEAELSIMRSEREMKVLEDSYNLNLRNKEKAVNLQERKRVNLSEIQIADYASLPMHSIRPRKLLYSGIALGASLLLALVAPFLAYFNDTTINTSSDVRRHLGINFVLENEAKEMDF